MCDLRCVGFTELIRYPTFIMFYIKLSYYLNCASNMMNAILLYAEVVLSIIILVS